VVTVASIRSCRVISKRSAASGDALADAMDDAANRAIVTIRRRKTGFIIYRFVFLGQVPKDTFVSNPGSLFRITRHTGEKIKPKLTQPDSSSAPRSLQIAVYSVLIYHITKKWLFVKMLPYGGLVKARHTVIYTDFPATGNAER
jgi:hypothetical protein